MLYLFLKNIKVYIKDFRILRISFHKIIKSMEKNKSKLKLDLTEKDQVLSLFKNMNYFIDIKNTKKNLYLIQSR